MDGDRGDVRVASRRALRGVALTLVVTWILSRTSRVQVNGCSMAPTLAAGDRLLVLKPGGPWRRARGGDIVVAEFQAVQDAGDDETTGQAIVKRAARVVAGRFELAGDNTHASTDSRTFGTVAAAKITGRAVYRYAPPDRVGRV